MDELESQWEDQNIKIATKNMDENEEGSTSIYIPEQQPTNMDLFYDAPEASNCKTHVTVDTDMMVAEAYNIDSNEDVIVAPMENEIEDTSADNAL